MWIAGHLHHNSRVMIHVKIWETTLFHVTRLDLLGPWLSLLCPPSYLQLYSRPCYGLWSIYFMHCYHPHGSNFYILLACTSGAVVYLCFLVSATCKTTTLGDARVGFAIVLPVGIFIIAIFLKFTDRHYIGWFGLGFSVLSHLCRIESTDYHGRFDIWVFIVSFVGAVNSFLWFIHPQLCLSMEYKVNSYITGVLRGGEAFYWCSRSIARFLWKFQGVAIQDAAPGAANAPAAPIGVAAAAINAPAVAPEIALMPIV
ncbi:unnamed protein product [Urochloa decumbens]|uniref:Uncharacterized protein n=2 Tax=Urochloa decumbens TaxID=240449 RepID=A0ABC9ABK2_9POAL